MGSISNAKDGLENNHKAERESLTLIRDNAKLN